MRAARVWLADLLMLVGACAVVAGSPFGLAWYVVPPLIIGGIGTALFGLAAAPGWWRAGAFIGVATSWTLVGPVTLLALAVARFVWPGRRVMTDRRLRVADTLMLLGGSLAVVGWLWGQAALPLALAAGAALAGFLLDRRNAWRAGVFGLVVIALAVSLWN